MEYFLSSRSGERTEGSAEDLIANKGITHDCPFCGKLASKGRSLTWITSECIKKGEATFPCNSCGRSIIVPTTIFARNSLGELSEKSFDQRINQVSDFLLGNLVNRMKPGELLQPDWGERIDKWNKNILR